MKPHSALARRPERIVIGTTLNGRFSLDKELGRGGMGAVYRATDLVLQRSVAIKVLRDRAGEEVGRKIRLEAQILARLVHDNIVRIYDFGETDGLYYFVMEEVNGASLHERMHRLPLTERLRILAEVADALDYAHHQGVIHRDIKPANVLTTASDQAKLSDFGLSLVVEHPHHDTSQIRGTPTYMSPEQAKGRRIDHRTDLYSLGVMLYECATGSPPFGGPPLGLLACHASMSPDPPRSRNSAISEGLETLILGLLEKEPAARPASGGIVARTLRELAPSEPFSSSLSGIRPAVSKATTRVTLVKPPTADIATPSEPPSDVPSTTVPTAKAPQGNAAFRSAVRMVETVISEPVELTPEERYLSGHYLAFLLGGSRRLGFFGRRPVDALNGDRARLLLAMTWLTMKNGDDDSVREAAKLLDERPEVRPLLNPVVVIKYLSGRDSPSKRKRFRRIRRSLQQASKRAADRLTDSRGALNPGLMPQVLDDLRKVAPAKSDIDDQLVNRWNRVADIWRGRDDLRDSVLHYATNGAWRDPASLELWPEVVYPLIERARRQRQLRSLPEAVLDHLCGMLRIPHAGLRFDQAMKDYVPAQVVEKIDLTLDQLADEPVLEPESESASNDPSSRLSTSSSVEAVSLHELASDLPRDRDFVRLVQPDPIRVSMEELHDLWLETYSTLKNSKVWGQGGVRHLPIGPYRMSVVATVRGRSAGEVVIQGMPNQKQIELLTPTLRVVSNRTAVAVWIYEDDSLVISFVDFRNTTRHILWHAPSTSQTNFDDPGELNSELLQLGLEAPDQLGAALTKRFRPHNAV